MDPSTLSDSLRRGSGLFLDCRRGSLIRAIVAALWMQLIARYPTGVIKHRPAPPLPRRDADRADAAAEAYHRSELPMPDAVQAGGLSREQWARHGAFCFGCLVAAVATFVAFFPALPEACATVRRLLPR